MFYNSIRRLFSVTLFVVVAIVGVGALSVNAQRGGQASITLTNSDAALCYVQDNNWDITKTTTDGPIAGKGPVSWTVTATKTAGAVTFTVHGGLTITNTGSAPATIGNIVINVQRPDGRKIGKTNVAWSAAAVNLADATNGDAATLANIVAAASAEIDNPLINNFYDISGAKGTFNKFNCGSLEFTDASNNSLWAITPQQTIPVGASVTLLYHANIAPAVAAAYVGRSLRIEALVSFGNAGGRGGSGATATTIDVNGNGNIDTDEANVRTVASRITTAPVPVLQQANSSVTVTDGGLTTSGSVTASNVTGLDQFPATISDTKVFDPVTADIDGGNDGGRVCNSAALEGTAITGTLGVVVGYDRTDPLNPIPIFATYTCAEAASDEASSCVDVTANDVPPPVYQYCTFSQGGYGNPGAPYVLLSNGFATAFPTGVETGIPGTAGYSSKFTSATAVQNYLPAGGAAKALTADSLNPTSTSSGQFGGQVLALKLSVGLSDAGALPHNGVGDLIYHNANDSLDGFTVRQILAVAETALGGGALPSGYSYSTLAGLVANLNLSGDSLPDCGPSAWANEHLTIPAP